MDMKLNPRAFRLVICNEVHVCIRVDDCIVVVTHECNFFGRATHDVNVL